MRSRSPGITLIALPLVVFCICALGQEKSAKVEGQLKFAASNPGPTCILLERQLKGETVQYLVTETVTKDNDNLDFEIFAAPGVYRVRARAFGFMDFISPPFQLEAGLKKNLTVHFRNELRNPFPDEIMRVEEPNFTKSRKGVERLVPIQTILRTMYSGIRTNQSLVITNSRDWEIFWNRVHRTEFVPPPPDTDFEKRIIIVSAFGEINTGGYETEIVRLVETSDDLEVWVNRKGPRVGDAVTMAFTQPLHIIETEKSLKRISFVSPRLAAKC